MQLNFVNIIQILIIYQAVFGILLLKNRAYFSGVIIFLFVLLLTMACNFLQEVIFPNSIKFTPIFLLAIGPAFYIFSTSMVYARKKVPISYLLHFCPTIIASFILHWTWLIIALGSISQLIYISLSLYKIKDYHKVSYSVRSDAEETQLYWIVKLVVFGVAIGIFDIVRLNIQPYIEIQTNLLGQLTVSVLGLLFITYLIYKSVHQGELFSGLNQYENNARKQDESSLKAEEELLGSVFESLDDLIRQKQLYKQQRLSLDEIASNTGFNIREISQAINQISGQSFCDYINSLRTEAVKQALIERTNKNESMIDLALRMGFSSKSNFNLVFKKQTNMTPSQFRKSIQ
ncbi:MAG: AraC family transcriptional regulator [Kangiellaceae bacterium]|nr:AraC family transcriptional regulator [Kangiellaceae bacterium]MCW9017513.1 AraC family transcriptional regulator [Kangiellaceae bacterium]